MSTGSDTPPEAGSTVRQTLTRGTVGFMGLELVALPGALVPRKETEILARLALDVVRARTDREGPQLVVDMCTGSGNLACAVAKGVPSTTLHASDLTTDAVSVARQNVTNLELALRVTVHQGDLFEPLRSMGLQGKVDVVICNPPYISTGKLEKESADLLRDEPREAFDGGPYGISIHQRVVKDALDFLKPGGVLALEVGSGQGRQVALLFSRARQYDSPTVVCDAAGSVRAVLATRSPRERAFL